MINLDIKLVGSINDENALEEIESIMNVFVYEQRMKDYIFPIRIQPPKKEVKKTNKEIGENTKFIRNNHPHILVKGLY